MLKFNCVICFSYTFSKKKTIRPDELENLGVKMKESGEVTLETEYDKIKDMDLEHWENVRGDNPSNIIMFNDQFKIIFLGPRPWENAKE